jgi:hypothetical protein
MCRTRKSDLTYDPEAMKETIYRSLLEAWKHIEEDL